MHGPTNIKIKQGLVSLFFSRYVTIQRSRKPSPEPEADDTVRDLDVQDITTEIRPVYTVTTETQPETRIQIVTPIRTLVTGRPAGFRKQSRDEKSDSATLEPELKVSSGGFRGATSESSVGTYPQYVDVTSIGRRRNITTMEIGKDTSTSPSPLEVTVSNVEVDATTSGYSGFNHTVPSSSSPRPFTDPHVAENQTQNVDTSSPGRRRGTTLTTTDISKDVVTTKKQTTVDTNPPKSTDISRRRSTTVPSVSTDPTTEEHKTKHDNAVLRRRSTTVRSTDILANETGPTKAEDSVVQPVSPYTVPTAVTESTSQGRPIPETLPTSTTTRFTPTVTRIVTSVTESGTTERQIIAVNRVPYLAIAALRGEKIYPGPSVHNRDHPAMNTTMPFRSKPFSDSSLEKTTVPVTVPSEEVFEKVMEVNRVELVNSKEETPLAYAMVVSGNDTTERMTIHTESEKTVDRVREVSRLKHVTVAGGTQTAAPLGDYMTDILHEEFTTLPTVIDTPTDKIYHENIIDIQRENPSSKREYYPTTNTLHLDSISTHSEPDTEPVPLPVTEKQTESIATFDEIGSRDIPPRTAPLNNRRRQGSGRRPGVNDFTTSRRRPTFSTSAEPQRASTPSTFSQKRRGQRKRPGPYRPTSTNATKEETSVLSVSNHSDVADPTDTAHNNEPRRSFIPSRGQRKRPRPYLPTSTRTTADEASNSGEKNGIQNSVLANEGTNNATLGFIPKRGNRRRGKTQVGITETSNTTSKVTSQEAILSTTENVSPDLDNSLGVSSTDRSTGGSSDNSQSSTQGLGVLRPGTRSRFVSRKGFVSRNVSAESNFNSTKGSDVFEVSDSKHTQSTDSVLLTTDTSTESQFELEVTELIPYSNSTGKYAEETEQGEKEIRRPSSIYAHTNSVTPASTTLSSLAPSISGRGESGRVRIKKRRRRPETNSSVTPSTGAEETSTESSKIASKNKLNVAQNEIKTPDLTSQRNFSVSTDEGNSVSSFATAALFGRDDYTAITPAPASDFVTTVDRGGKRVVQISVLNGPSDRNVPHITQKSKSVSTKNTSKVKNATARNNSNNFEISSDNSELTTTKNNDLHIDGSGYSEGSAQREPVYPLSTSVRTTSARGHESFLTTTLEFLTEGHNEEISHKNSTEVPHNGQSTDNFIASVDFIADSRDDGTLSSTPANGRNKPVSENTEGKSWRLVRRKRPSSTTVEPQAQSEVG